jgi:1-acyl-sn-glycerol-3-phosphate acyltransferase
LERYFAEPYRFIPPFRSTFWCHFAGALMPRQLRRTRDVHRWHFYGLEHLRSAVANKAGVLIASNHCRSCDPMVLGVMGTTARMYLYYVASHHLFRQSRLMGMILNRIGGYSILREGTDRESIRATVSILTEAERPVVLFPEGTFFRQNDRVHPLQEGLSLITRQAVKQCERPIVVIPAAVKYWMLHDPRPALARRLEALEGRLGWRPQTHLDLVARLEKLGSGLLAVKEVEHAGEPRSGPLEERIAALVELLTARLEDRHLNKRHDGWPLERVRRLRQHLSRRLMDPKTDAASLAEVKRDLDEMVFVENLGAQSVDYLREDPSAERLVETLQRIEETIDDADEKAVVQMGVTVRLGPPIDARALGEGAKGEAFVSMLRGQMQGLLDEELTQGPPAEWDCPTKPRPPAARGADPQTVLPAPAQGGETATSQITTEPAPPGPKLGG